MAEISGLNMPLWLRDPFNPPLRNPHVDFTGNLLEVSWGKDNLAVLVVNNWGYVSLSMVPHLEGLDLELIAVFLINNTHGFVEQRFGYVIIMVWFLQLCFSVVM